MDYTQPIQKFTTAMYFIFSLIRITVMGSDEKIDLDLNRHHTTLFVYVLV